ncbi:MAG: acylneuraminate cytidylyltransferase family protein [Nanoarchaeota archaeon]
MIIAIILARGGSKRIPHKNIVNFCDKPLLAWTIEQAKDSKQIENVYVSTDDDKIKKVAEKYGAEVIDRPKAISGDHATSEDALKHAIDTIGGNTNKKIDFVVFLQPTSPLRETKDIDNAIQTIKEKKADSLFSSGKLGDFYIWKNYKGKFTSLNYNYKNRKRSQEFGEQFVENGSIYVFKPEVLYSNNRLGGKIAISIMDFWKSFEIDRKEDLEFCEDIFKLKKLNRKRK